MIKIVLDRNKLIYGIIISLVLGYILIYLKTKTKEGGLFNMIKNFNTTCKKKTRSTRRIITTRLKLKRPDCKDTIIPRRNTVRQTVYINNTLPNIVPIPEATSAKIESTMPIELEPYKDVIKKVIQLTIAKELTPPSTTSDNLEKLIGNLLYDIDEPELISIAPYIKLYIESEPMQQIIKETQASIPPKAKGEIITEIQKNKEIINEPTIPLSPNELDSIIFNYKDYTARCGVVYV